MTKPRMNLHVMHISSGIGFAQFGQFRFPTGRHLVSVVAAIALAHVEGESQVAQAHGRSLIWMPSHHRRRGKTVGHARSQLIHAIAAGRITHQVNPIGICPVQRHKVFDQPVKEAIDVALMPKIPRVGRRPRSHVNALLRPVQAFLIFPLSVVHTCRGLPTAVHGNE